MASPHFVLFPFMAQGHMIPMIDLANLLAHRGATVTILTTPINAARHHSLLSRAAARGLPIHVVLLQFPCSDAGLPHGCESFDLLPSDTPIPSFFAATKLLHHPSETTLRRLRPPPTAIISDTCFPWTLRISQKHNIPRIVFYSFSFFYLLCSHSITAKEDLIRSLSDSQSVDLTDGFEFRKSQLPMSGNADLQNLLKEWNEADGLSYGVVVNSFEEMEAKYLAEYKNTRASPEKVWCVGPVSLCNADERDRADRGNRAAIDEHECVKWLDGQEHSSVVYASLGSLCNLAAPQLVELGLGLEASNKPFIWAIRKEIITEELLKWVHKFEAKIKGRGVLIRGWAPQVLILSHPAIGCFLTHCGWNSSIEGMSAGVPMITWPLFADQVFNETLMVEILGIGVRVGVVDSLQWGEEEKKRVLVTREDVREAIEMVMNGDERREKCKKLAEKAKIAVEEGGSSHRNLTQLMEDEGFGKDQNLTSNN